MGSDDYRGRCGGRLAGGLHLDIFLAIPTSHASEKALRVPDPLRARWWPVTDLLPALKQRISPPMRQVGPTSSSHQNFYFWNGGLSPAFSSGMSSRPHDPAYSTAGAFLREGG